jgi:hypothetical protein
MTLTDALKIPGVWWVVLEGYTYPQDGQPDKVEVIEVLEGGRHSSIRINNGEVSRAIHKFNDWEAYPNYWLAWAAVQRSKAND